MTSMLYGHPFSSYTQKVLIAFYEKGVPFTYRILGPDDPEAARELAALWPLKRFPVLTDGELRLFEASLIVEYLDILHPGPVPLVPSDPKAALGIRMLDRVFDNYVMAPTQAIVFDFRRPVDQRDPVGVAEARAALDTIYHWLNATLASRKWAAGDAFSLADCAAAPSLFYADWVHPIPDALPHLRAYRNRLLARPSFARAVNEARPFRFLFPPGAPDRD